MGRWVPRGGTAAPLAMAAVLLACTPALPGPSPASTVPELGAEASRSSAAASARRPDPLQRTSAAPCAPEGDADAQEIRWVDAATWTQAEGGSSLRVTPSAALRECGGVLAQVGDPPLGWAQALALSGSDSAADTPSMRQQYACHLRFARTKEHWALEPWRPEASAELLQATQCNP